MNRYLILVATSLVGTLPAMEYTKLSSDNTIHHIIKEVPYVTEITDHDAIAYDTKNPCHILFGNEEGLMLYDYKKQTHWQYKPSDFHQFFSLQSYQTKNHHLIAYGDNNGIGVWNQTTETNNQKPLKLLARVRFLSLATKIAVATYSNRKEIDIYETESLRKLITINSDQKINGLAPFEQSGLVTWDDKKANIYDLRQPDEVCGSIEKEGIYSVVTHKNQLLFGTTDGECMLFDIKKMKPILSRIIKKDNVVAMNSHQSKPHKVVAACSDKIAIIDANKGTMKAMYHIQGKTNWVRNPHWIGCNYNGENLVTVNWDGICDQEPEEGVKNVISVIDLKKIWKEDRPKTRWQKYFHKKE